MKKFIILQLAGFGDTLSAITRLPAVKEKYPEHEIVFYLGGYGKSVDFSKEQLEREGYKANIIKNLNFHNQLPEIRKLIKDNFVSDGDIFEDWSFCDEIFKNQEPPFYKFPMQFPYNYKTNVETEKRDSETVIAIHPLTKSGNAEGFESDVEKGRFWTRTNWKRLCDKLINDGHTLAFVGHGDEDWGLIEELTNEGHKVLDKRMGVEETISFLQTVDGGIFCNSWDWEVTSRIGIPTVCFYTKNFFFIQNHVPHGISDFWNTCYIETRHETYARHISQNKQSSIKVMDKHIYDKFNYILNVKNKPFFGYDICMISYNDEEYIHNTLENVEPYIRNKFCVVDGGSTDNTVDIIKNTIPANKLNFKEIKWDNKFDVQKNNAIEMSEKMWVVFIDADETYEHLFWNQLGWYIAEATQKGSDCISVSRINTYKDVDEKELFNFVKKQNWKINQFGWVNYPDFQQRIFKSDLRFKGSVHEKIQPNQFELLMVPINCIHNKSFIKQKKSLELYDRIEGKNV